MTEPTQEPPQAPKPQPATEGAQELIREIRKRLNVLVVATVVLFVSIGAVGAYSYTVADQNRQAVCNLRTDLQHRVATSEEFVTEHPEALKQFGITKAQAAKEVSNQKRTLNALSVVSC
jgi:uncharacterized protein YpmB